MIDDMARAASRHFPHYFQWVRALEPRISEMADEQIRAELVGLPFVFNGMGLSEAISYAGIDEAAQRRLNSVFIAELYADVEFRWVFHIIRRMDKMTDEEIAADLIRFRSQFIIEDDVLEMAAAEVAVDSEVRERLYRIVVDVMAGKAH